MSQNKIELISDQLMSDRAKIREEYKKIANFMGHNHTADSLNTEEALSLNFRHDWNSLMRVVDRIEKLESQKFGGFHVHIDKDCVLIQAKNRTKESTYSKMYCGNKDKKKAVYESVLLFIEFWNKNN